MSPQGHDIGHRVPAALRAKAASAQQMGWLAEASQAIVVGDRQWPALA